MLCSAVIVGAPTTRSGSCWNTGGVLLPFTVTDLKGEFRELRPTFNPAELAATAAVVAAVIGVVLLIGRLWWQTRRRAGGMEP